MIKKEFIDEIRIIIAGTRTFEDYGLLKDRVDRIILGLREDFPGKRIVIVTGAAKGADQLGSRYARERVLALREFPANWRAYGRAAGPIRNQQMLDYILQATPVLIAFWNGKSRGTKNMIDTAKRAGVKTTVIYYEEAA